MQRKNNDYIDAIEYSHDGQIFATGGEDQVARIWTADNGWLVREFVGHSAPITALSFSKDGCYLATGGGRRDNTVRVWSIHSGKELRAFQHPLGITSVAFSPDGKFILSGNEDGIARLWSMEGSREVWRYNENDGTVKLSSGGIRSVGFSKDGLQAFTLGMTLRAWSTVELPWKLVVETKDIIQAAAFAPAGRLLTLSSTLGNRDPYLVVSRDNNRYAASAGRNIQVRSTDTDEVIFSHEFDQQSLGLFPVPIALSPDGNRFVASNPQSQLIMLNLDNGNASSLAESHEVILESSAFSDDGRLAILGSAGGSVYLWSVQEGAIIGKFSHGAGVAAVALSQDHKLALTGGKNGLKLWSIETEQQLWSFNDPTLEVNTVDFSPDGSLMLAASSDRTAVWSLQNLKNPQLIRKLGGVYRHGAWFSADSKSILLSNGAEPVLVSVSDGSLQTRLSTGDFELYRKLIHGSFVKAGKLYSRNIDGSEHEIVLPTNLLMDVPDGLWSAGPNGFSVLSGDNAWHQLDKLTLAGHKAPVIAAAFSADSKRVLTGSEDGQAFMWMANTGELRKSFTVRGVEPFFQPRSRYVESVAFSPDDRWVVTGGGFSVRIWPDGGGTPTIELSTSTGYVNSVSFTADGRLISAVTSDGSVWLWDAQSGAQLARSVVLRDGSWVSVQPGGRFDTRYVENIQSVRWVMPDDVAQSLPPEIFMRDYYEPRLLPRLLACHEAQAAGEADACAKAFKPVRPLGELNRVQPVVKIVGVRQGGTPEMALVDVEASAVEDASQKNGKTRTDVYDLRLFRNG
ncbi:hypothetical protein AAII07_58910, partial [Microvirga sp. 0TCS3.31]